MTTDFKYYVYKTTNKINAKIYVGVHRSADIDNDSYLGSGKTMRKAIKKYGEDSFEREILACFDSADEAFSLEKEIVDAGFISRNDTYNIVIGGRGFYFERKEDHPMYGKTISEEHKEIVSENIKKYFSNDENLKKHKEKRKEWCSKEENKEILRENGRKIWRNPEFRKSRKEKMEKLYSDPEFIEKLSESAKERERRYGNGFKGKCHTEETKKKMRGPRESIRGSNHPGYGKSHSDERKRKQSEAMKNKPKVKCPHCEKSGSSGNMKRWHFDNCKYKLE